MLLRRRVEMLATFLKAHLVVRFPQMQPVERVPNEIRNRVIERCTQKSAARGLGSGRQKSPAHEVRSCQRESLVCILALLAPGFGFRNRHSPREVPHNGLKLISNGHAEVPSFALDLAAFRFSPGGSARPPARYRSRLNLRSRSLRSGCLFCCLPIMARYWRSAI